MWRALFALALLLVIGPEPARAGEALHQLFANSSTVSLLIGCKVFAIFLFRGLIFGRSLPWSGAFGCAWTNC